ncbi:hypothetical protein GmHk_09G025473 [Glycine max]|nr:hypothetical protein GmHk_09G025473 [Glycine max]
MWVGPLPHVLVLVLVLILILILRISPIHSTWSCILLCPVEKKANLGPHQHNNQCNLHVNQQWSHNILNLARHIITLSSQNLKQEKFNHSSWLAPIRSSPTCFYGTTPTSVATTRTLYLRI